MLARCWIAQRWASLRSAPTYNSNAGRGFGFTEAALVGGIAQRWPLLRSAPTDKSELF
jgi:hypothetical protein